MPRKALLFPCADTILCSLVCRNLVCVQCHLLVCPCNYGSTAARVGSEQGSAPAQHRVVHNSQASSRCTIATRLQSVISQYQGTLCSPYQAQNEGHLPRAAVACRAMYTEHTDRPSPPTPTHTLSITSTPHIPPDTPCTNIFPSRTLPLLPWINFQCV
jgi:hypothetical protein